MTTVPSTPSAPPAESAVLPAAEPPLDALRLGYAGLLPFVAGAALVWGVRGEAHAYAVQALATYAAVIASFLGGIHWGIRIGHPGVGAIGGAGGRSDAGSPAAHLGWGVCPALVGWVALLMRADAGLVLQGVLLVVCYLVDRRVYPQYGAAAWLTLRFRLSAVAALACFLGAAGA